MGQFNVQNVKKGHFPHLKVLLHVNHAIKDNIKVNKGKINAFYVLLDNIMINLVKYRVLNALLMVILIGLEQLYANFARKANMHMNKEYA